MRNIGPVVLVFFLAFSARLGAMPPHPDLVKSYQEEGHLNILMNRVDAITAKRSMNMNAPLNAVSPGGIKRIPVLLIEFAIPYQLSSEIVSDTWKNYNRNLLVYLPLFIITILFLVLAGYRGNLNRALFRPFVPFSLLIFAAVISCGTDKKEEDDYEDFPTNPVIYSRLLNGFTSSDLSVRKYYQDMSNGSLNLIFDIYGPVKVSRSWDYYGKNFAGNDIHSGELAGEALRLMVSKYSSVNFSVYDNDSNGSVDAVILIHEGRGEESGGGVDTIWSNQWDLKSAGLAGDGNGPVSATGGVYFDIYTMQPEYTYIRGDSSIGVFTHEFGHVLGLADIYDTSDVTYGVGNWSLMGSGAWKGPGALINGTTPAPLLAWERYKIGGSSWVTITTLASANNQALGDIEVSRTAFKVMLDPAPGNNQYLIIEGKSASTSLQWYVAGTGLLISHVHEGVIAKYTPTDEVNAGSARVHGINILEADGSDLWSKTNQGSAGDLYTAGGITDAIIYTDNTNYTLANSATTKDVNDITLISPSPLSMTFDVVP